MELFTQRADSLIDLASTPDSSASCSNLLGGLEAIATALGSGHHLLIIVTDCVINCGPA